MCKAFQLLIIMKYVNSFKNKHFNNCLSIRDE